MKLQNKKSNRIVEIKKAKYGLGFYYVVKTLDTKSFLYESGVFLIKEDAVRSSHQRLIGLVG